MLAEGEPFDSPRARAQAGPHATIVLHNLVEREQFGDFGRGIPPETVAGALDFSAIHSAGGAIPQDL